MTHAVQTLPEGYAAEETVDLQKDRKAMLRVNGLGILLLLVLFFGMLFFVPFPDIRALTAGDRIASILVIVAGFAAYLVLHELTHAAVMKAHGGRQVRFGFTGMYAFAGSEQDYFGRTAYIRIALAPFLVWSAVFAVLCLALPSVWFWPVWFLAASHVSGCAGDLYITWVTLKKPRDVLIRDTGINMTFFTRENAAEKDA